MRKLIKNINFLPILIVVVFAILAARSLIFERGYFNMHDDLQMMRQLELEKCFDDGQIPCRWVPDMGYGYGFPLFNFYPPLPYLVGQVYREVGFSFVETVKLTFALSFILSGVAMYFLSKEFFGRWGGVLSATFYIWAPYHSVDVYVRGAMNEAWALIWFPLILLFIYKKKYLFLALSVAALLMTHNLMVLIFSPVAAVWAIYWLIKSKSILSDIKNLALSGVFALSLSAFFTLPAIFEQKFVHVATLTQGYYEYIAHFATIGQLLTSRFWGYGPSIWGPNDGMPFTVGHVHWILSLTVLGIATTLLILKKVPKSGRKTLFVVYLFIAAGWFASFMAHQNSTFIWQHIKPLAFVQFPWRFLTLTIFSLSFVAGSVFILLPKKIATVAGVILAFLVIVTNWSYFTPKDGKMGPLSDEEKFAGAAWDLQRTAGIFDYLPLTAEQNPKDGQSFLAEIMEGEGVISNTSQGTDWARFSVDGTGSVIRIGIFEFPNWKASIDGVEVDHYVPETEKWGRIYVNVPEGTHEVYLKLENTKIRTISNALSLVAWLGLVGFLGSKMLQSKRG